MNDKAASINEWTEAYLRGDLSRRDFIRRLVLAGFAASTAGAIITATGARAQSPSGSSPAIPAGSPAPASGLSGGQVVNPFDMNIYTRSGGSAIELPYEKPVVVPHTGDDDPARHAWADARFAADIMAEHALFFALLMPQELAPRERAQALEFSGEFSVLYERIDQQGPPARGDVRAFTNGVIEQIKPFIEYKARLGEAQRTGELRSLVWPLFFDHTRDEAERWSRRLATVGAGESEFDQGEVVSFWLDIMEQHARFVAHLLDPDEFDLVAKATGTSQDLRQLKEDIGDAPFADPDLESVTAAARNVLEFKTQAARDIEAARIKSIIDPRLADHVRREALKFVDELKRAE